MDATELDAAYTDLLTAAAAISDTTALAPDTQSAVNWPLSHLALSDGTLAAAARKVLTGLSVTTDNRDAMDTTAVASLVASTTHASVSTWCGATRPTSPPRSRRSPTMPPPHLYTSPGQPRGPAGPRPAVALGRPDPSPCEQAPSRTHCAAQSARQL
jgi:hypothetical protein